MNVFTSLKTAALDMLFPLRCAGKCGSEGVALCTSCSTGMRIIPPSCFVCKKLIPARATVAPGRTCTPCRRKTSVYAFVSPYSYDTPIIKNLIHDLKYRRVRTHAPVLADLLCAYFRYCQIAIPSGALLIAIPLHKKRERTRGFNQSRLIADKLAEKLGIEVRGDILQKTKKTTPQMELSREERLKNMDGVFAVSDTSPVRNRTILLLDDVKTTGATLEQAARALKSAGAKKIWAITVAH